MYMPRVFLSTWVLLSCGTGLRAEHFCYGDKEPVGVHKERSSGQHRGISVYGPTEGSYVKGRYDDANGVLKISVDRLSYLEVRGRAKGVIITFVDLNSNVNLSSLDAGVGGVEIYSVKRRSKVDIGPCRGAATIKSVESASISVLPETKVVGREKLTEGSKLDFKKPSFAVQIDR